MTKALSLVVLASLLLPGCFVGGAAKPSLSQQRLADLQERAQLSADNGLRDDAGRLLQEALQLASSLDNRQGQTSVLLQQARLARQYGDRATAEQAVNRALALSTGSTSYADAAQEKSLQELAAGKTDAAVQWAETALREERGELLARRLNLLARLALLQGKLDAAAARAEQALNHASSEQLATERANALRMLGSMKGRQGQYIEGERLLGQALALDKGLELPTRIAADLDALAELSRLQGDVSRQQAYQQRAETVRSAIGIRGEDTETKRDSSQR